MRGMAIISNYLKGCHAAEGRTGNCDETSGWGAGLDLGSYTTLTATATEDRGPTSGDGPVAGDI